MCGRYSLSSPADLVAEVFELDETPALAPRFNIAPTQEVPVVRLGPDRRRRLDQLRWGLVPHWVAEPSATQRTINARSETVEQKPSFRDSYHRRRCLVPADGFYEWRREGTKRQPFHFRLRSGRPFAFAGLWDRWSGPGAEPIESFTILTTAANQLVTTVHPRMPVILAADDFGVWLDSRGADRATLHSLLQPYPDAEMFGYPVSPFVNNPANEAPHCVEPLGSRPLG